MTTTPVEVQGTLRLDGTLVLDSKPDVPPGRVRVTLQPVLDYTQTEMWQFFQRIWAEQNASGRHQRSAEEIDADIAAAQRDDEEYMLEMDRIRDECQNHRGSQTGEEDA